jgi:hypothetical protein
MIGEKPLRRQSSLFLIVLKGCGFPPLVPSLASKKGVPFLNPIVHCLLIVFKDKNKV